MLFYFHKNYSDHYYRFKLINLLFPIIIVHAASLDIFPIFRNKKSSINDKQIVLIKNLPVCAATARILILCGYL